MFYIECSPKTTDYTLAISEKTTKKFYLLNQYEPKEKALENLKNIDLGNKSTIWIVFGFQFGYIIDKLIETIGEKVNILIIEPNKVILYESLELCGHYYEKKAHIRFFSGTDWMQLKEILNELIGMENFNNFRIVPTKEYLAYYKDYYDQVLKLISTCSEDKMMNYHTIILGNTHNIVNTVQNRYDLAKTCDMNRLYNKFKNIPAVLVLAGPSLDKNIEYLKEFKGLIFVVGRTITPVLKLGVKPDLIFAVDPYDFSIETFGEHKEYDVPLVALGQCHHNVVKGCQSPYKYFIYNSSELKGLLGLTVNPCLDLAGSVATLCLSTAEVFGCSPIIWIGQDLAFSEGKMYASNADALYTEDKKNTFILKKIKGYYGDEVYSEFGMVNFLHWIEGFIYYHPSSKYINCTEGGAYIEGAEHIPFKEAISLYNPENKITIDHKFLKDNENIDIDQNFLEGVEGIKTIKECVHDSLKDFDALIKFYQEGKTTKKYQKQLLKHLKNIKERDKKIEKVERIRFIMDMLIERAKFAISASNDCKEPLRETENEYRIRYLRVNRETYDYLEKECDKLLDLLKPEIEQILKKENIKIENKEII